MIASYHFDALLVEVYVKPIQDTNGFSLDRVSLSSAYDTYDILDIRLGVFCLHHLYMRPPVVNGKRVLGDRSHGTDYGNARMQIDVPYGNYCCRCSSDHHITSIFSPCMTTLCASIKLC